MPAAFRTNLLSLVDRGFVYAIAHIAAGHREGLALYLDGKREKKPNTFTDFIACARALIAARTNRREAHRRPWRLGGRDADGGVANLAPDLFAGIVADVPFVDVLNTMLDAELPLTPRNGPNGATRRERDRLPDDPGVLPYDNVAAKDYRRSWRSRGLTDPRVTYWEPAKWVARCAPP